MGQTTQIDQELLNQVRFGEKLKAVIGKNYGNSTITSTWYQVTLSKKVDFFIIAKTANLASQFKTFLGNNFGINHSPVSGVDVTLTLVINLSDLTTDSLARLKLAYKNKVSNENIPEHKLQVIIETIKFSKQKLDEDSSATNDDEIVENGKTTPSPVEKKTNIDRFRCSFEIFLSQISSFEVTQKSRTNLRLNNLFSYEESDSYLQTLNCNDEVTAFYVEKAACYFVNGYENSTVIRDAKTVVINCEPFLNGEKKRRPLMGSFCLPPNENSDADEVINRLRKIACMTRPSVEQVDHGVFRVKYFGPETLIKMHKIISIFGWRCQLEEQSILVVAGGYPLRECKEGDSSSTEGNSDEGVTVSEENDDENSQGTNTDGLEVLESEEDDHSGVEINEEEIQVDDDSQNPESSEPAKAIIEPSDEIQEGKTQVDEEASKSAKISLVAELSKVHLVLSPICKFSGSKKEGIEKLQKIYLDQTLFLTFSPDNQKKITDLLQKHWIDEHPEEYAMSIVKFLENN